MGHHRILSFCSTPGQYIFHRHHCAHPCRTIPAEEFHRAAITSWWAIWTRAPDDRTPTNIAQAILANRKAASTLYRSWLSRADLEKYQTLDALYATTPSRANPASSSASGTSPSTSLFTRNRHNLRTQTEAYYRASMHEYARCVALVNSSLQPGLNSSEAAHLQHITPLLRAAAWIRHSVSSLPGAGQLLAHHTLCPYHARDFRAFRPTSLLTILDPGMALLQVIVTGFPLDASDRALLDRLRQLGVEPTSPLLLTSGCTAQATVTVRHSLAVWQIIQGLQPAYYESTPDHTYSHMLGIWVDDPSLGNILRMRIVHDSSQPCMTLPAVMHAVGFQQEEFQRILAWGLRSQRIPAISV